MALWQGRIKHPKVLAKQGIGDRWESKPWANVDPRIGGVLPSKIWKNTSYGSRKYMGYEKTLNPRQQKRADSIAAYNKQEDTPVQASNTKAPDPKSALARSAARNISTPKTVSKVSRRIKQKLSNQRAGIRT